MADYFQLRWERKNYLLILSMRLRVLENKRSLCESFISGFFFQEEELKIEDMLSGASTWKLKFHVFRSWNNMCHVLHYRSEDEKNEFRKVMRILLMKNGWKFNFIWK